MFCLRSVWTSIIFSFALLFAIPALAEEVDLQLVLAVDVSSSINYDEFDLQVRGYVAAFRSDPVLDAIQSGRLGKIAVSMTHWAGLEEQKTVLDWTVLENKADMEAFAVKLENLPRRFPYGGTAIAPALSHAQAQFLKSPYTSSRRIIDISGDGKVSIGPSPIPVRKRIVASGIVINGLPILNETADLDRYYLKNLIGGIGSFIQVSADFKDFSLAIQKKLAREIKGLWYGV